MFGCLEVRNQVRLCNVDGKQGLFHGFYQRSWTHGGGISIGSFPPGQESFPVAVVEFDIGKVECVRAEDVVFTDSSEYEFAEGEANDAR